MRKSLGVIVLVVMVGAALGQEAATQSRSLVMPPDPAATQPVSREEVDKLKSEISKLKAENAALKKQVADLQGKATDATAEMEAAVKAGKPVVGMTLEQIKKLCKGPVIMKSQEADSATYEFWGKLPNAEGSKRQFYYLLSGSFLNGKLTGFSKLGPAQPAD